VSIIFLFEVCLKAVNYKTLFQREKKRELKLYRYN